MEQTIQCTVVFCRAAHVLYVVSPRPHGPYENQLSYAGQRIEASEAALPGLPQVPAHWLERLQELAFSNDARIPMELVDEFSGGDPIPAERPYFPWDLEPAARSQEQDDAGEQLPF